MIVAELSMIFFCKKKVANATPSSMQYIDFIVLFIAHCDLHGWFEFWRN